MSPKQDKPTEISSDNVQDLVEQAVRASWRSGLVPDTYLVSETEKQAFIFQAELEKQQQPSAQKLEEQTRINLDQFGEPTSASSRSTPKPR